MPTMDCTNTVTQSRCTILLHTAFIGHPLYPYVAEECITCDSLHLMTESDLSMLGFKLGSRKLLMQWNAAQKSPTGKLQS